MNQDGQFVRHRAVFFLVLFALFSVIVNALDAPVRIRRVFLI
jgi:hypothetical protein